MKSPPKFSVGFTYLLLFDSIFKEYSDPTYPRSDATKLCVLLSGGVSAISTASSLRFSSDSATLERYSLLHSAMLRRSSFHNSKPPSQIYFLPPDCNIALQKQNNRLFKFFFQEYNLKVKCLTSRYTPALTFRLQ